MNIFKNAFEASATQISLKALCNDTRLLLEIEDNGEGCSEEQLGNLFKSFYTTKKNSGGTGLGMCIMRSIIEGHGGYISVYSKNLLDNGTHGLILNIAFPIYNEEIKQASDKKAPIVLIQEGVENLPQIIRNFQNILVTPYIFQRAADIYLKKAVLDKMAIYASINSVAFLKNESLTNKNIHTLIRGSKNSVFVVNESKTKTIQAFSEKYILENMGESM